MCSLNEMLVFCIHRSTMNNSNQLDDGLGAECNGTCPERVFTPSIYLAYNAYLCVSIALGIAGNGLVLMVFAKYKVSTSTDWFIFFITVFDFISSFVTVPVYLTVSTGFWKHIGNDIMCKIHMFISQSVVLCSTFLICGLAIERYFKVCVKSGVQITKSRALRICVAIACVTILLSLPCFEMFKNIKGECMANTLVKGVFVYYLMVLLTYILAFIVVTVSYTKISIAVLKSEKNVSRHVANNQAERNNWCCLKPNSHRVEPLDFGTSTISTVQDENTKKVNTIATFTTHSGNTTSTSTHNTTPSNILHVPYFTKRIQVMPSSSVERANKPSKDEDRIVSSGPSRVSQTTVECSRLYRGKKTTLITFAVCIIFIVSWIPPWVGFLLLSIPELRVNRHVIVFGRLFGRTTFLLNTFMNPILYLCMNGKFREKASHFICCWKRPNH